MVSLISQWGHKNGAYEYVIDTLNDLENVPTDVAVGTVVFCIENSKTYMLNGSGVYVEVNFKKGGKGGDKKLGSKEIYENGVYRAENDELDGYSQVEVNVDDESSDNVTVSENEPTAQQGTEGDIWIQYGYLYPRETVTREYTLNITRAWRGSDSLSYAGATELDIIFDDGNGNEVSIRDLTGFTYSASGGTIKNAFDNNTNTYWENSPTPIWCKMSATVPAGYVVKYLKAMQRTGSFTTDVWRDFNFIETANGIDTTLIERTELTQEDWAGAGNYTSFENNTPDDIVIKNTFIKVDTTWMSPAQIDINIKERPQLTTKLISENGTYRARDDGYYGYSEVTVSNTEAIIGINSTDENEYYVEADNNNYLVETLLPSRIEVVTPPTKIVYADGEAIDTTDMIVKAYSRDDSLWENTGYTGGIISLNEITIEPTIVELGGEQTIYKTKGTYSGCPIRLIEIPANSNLLCGENGDTLAWVENRANTYVRIAIVDYDDIYHRYFTASPEGFALTMHTENKEGYGGGGDGFSSMEGTVTIDGKSAYKGHSNIPVRNSCSWENNLNVIPRNDFGSEPLPNSNTMMWEMLYDVESINNVQVKWNRIKDNKLLTSNFEITVE